MSLITDPLLKGAETREQTARVIKMLEDGGPKYSRAWYTYDQTKFLLRRALQATLFHSPDVWRKPESTHWVVPTYDFDRRMPSHVRGGVFDAEMWTWSRKYSGSRLWGLARSDNDGTLWLRYEAWCAVSEEDSRASGILHIHKYTHVKVEPGVRIILSDRFMHSVLDRAERYGVCQPRSATEPVYYERRLPKCISIREATTTRSGPGATGITPKAESCLVLRLEGELVEFGEMSAEALHLQEVDLLGLTEMLRGWPHPCGFSIGRGSVSANVYLFWPAAKVRMRLQRLRETIEPEGAYGLPLLQRVDYQAAVCVSAVVRCAYVRDIGAKPVEVWGELYQPIPVDADGSVVWRLAREQVLEDWYAGCEPESSKNVYNRVLVGLTPEAVSSDHMSSDGSSVSSSVSDESDWDEIGDSDSRRLKFHPGGRVSDNDYRMAAEWAVNTCARDGGLPEILGLAAAGECDDVKSKWVSLYEHVCTASFDIADLEEVSSLASQDIGAVGFGSIGCGDPDGSTRITSLASDDASEVSESDGLSVGREEDAWQASFWSATEEDGARLRPVADIVSPRAFGMLRDHIERVLRNQLRVVSGAEPDDIRYVQAREMYIGNFMRGEARYEIAWPLFLDRRAYEIFVAAAGDFHYELGAVGRMLMRVDVANANLWTVVIKCYDERLAAG